MKMTHEDDRPAEQSEQRRSVLSDALASYAAYAMPGFLSWYEAHERQSDAPKGSPLDLLLTVLAVLLLLFAVAVMAGFID
jgi:hypothetical protein